MAEKCSLCNEEVQTTFLEKKVGTIIKTGSGETSKKHTICSSCQKQFGDKLKEQLS